MCGRYTLFTDKELKEVDDIIEKIDNDIKRDKMKTGEICPTDVAPVILFEKEIVVPRLLTWGFPNFQNKGVIINARGETVNEKRMFRFLMETKRCVIPSTGFYEWDKEKNKYLINLAGTPMLYMAGLYNEFEGEGRFVIITTNSNSSISNIHDRMPVVLEKNLIEDWLRDRECAQEMLKWEHPGLSIKLA